MKTLSITARALLLVVATALLQNIFAQSTDEKTAQGKFHINIINEENGNKEVIDRTFSSKGEMDSFIKENKIMAPDLPEIKDAGASPSGDKKSKKIIIIEKEKGSAGKTDLDIAFENFSPSERANLIQEMMDKKDSKVKIKQIRSAANSVQEKITIMEREEGKPDASTELNIDFSGFSPGERAKLIQEMVDRKDSKIVIKQVTDNTAGLQEKDPNAGSPHNGIASLTGVSDLRLFPNPNKGQFHVSFSTEKPTDVELRMMDMDGREVYNETIKGNNGAFDKDINVPPAISAGSYVLEAVANGQKITTQVVVQ